MNLLFQAVLLLGVLGLSLNVYGQTERKLFEGYTANDQHDTLRVKGLVGLGKSYRTSNPSKAIYYFENAEKIINDKLLNKDQFQDFYLDQLTMVYNGIGVVYRNFDNYPQALESYKKALNLLETHDNIRVKSSVLFNIAFLNVQEGNLDDGLSYMKQSLTVRKRIADTLGLINCYRHLGHIKEMQNEVDEAVFFFEEGLHLASMIKDTSRTLRMYEYYVEMYSNRGELARAEELLNEGMGFVKGRKNSRNHHSRMSIPLCQIYYQNGEIQKGIAICKASLAWHNENKPNQRLSKLHQLLAEGYQRLGDYKSANTWMRSRIKIDSTILVNENISEVVRIEMNYLFNKERIADSLKRVQEIQISNLKLDKKNTTIQKNRTRIIGLATGILMLLVIALFWYRNFVLKRKALELKEKDVENMSLKIKRESAWIDNLVALNLKIKKNKVTDVEEQIQELVNEMKDTLVVDKHRQVVAKNVEVVSMEFKNKLKKRFPNLTKTEIEMCELIRLELSNLEIARIRDVSQNSAKMARYRLKKKLSIAPEQSISEVLKGI